MFNSSVPESEVRALHDIYIYLNGNDWRWRNLTISGPTWNFNDTYSNIDPCLGADLNWQGLSCVTDLLGSPCERKGSSGQHTSQHCHIRDLDLVAMKLVGSIPSTILQLSYLEALFLGVSCINKLPSELSLLPDLLRLSIVDSCLTGQLPTELGNLHKLIVLDFTGNQFHGHIPESYSMLYALTQFSLSRNSLSGFFPLHIFHNMTRLLNLLVSNNHFTGVLPDTWNQIPAKILFLSLNDNLFTGTLPESLGNLTSLLGMPFGNNYFSGSIPSSYGCLAHLAAIDLSYCDLTGTIPSTFQSLTRLETLKLSFNHLDGQLPTFIGGLDRLQFLQLNNNHFHSKIPNEWNQLTRLGVLQLQGNHLTGHLSNFFSNSRSMALVNIDFSDNLLTGNIPNDLFQIYNLRTIALGSNCFHGTLPEGICSGERLNLISFDGLSSSFHCSKYFTFEFSDVTVVNTVDGTIPSCIWNMPYLITLHLMGNGLTGPIKIPYSRISSSIKDINLAHNYLTSTIPKALQVFSYRTLDLSYNKLTGDITNIVMEYNSQFSSLTASINNTDNTISNTTIIINNNSEMSLLQEITTESLFSTKLRLKENRLSGKVPREVSLITKLDILEGNMFSCHGYNPSGDNSYGYYTCGSEQLDRSLYLWFCFFGFFFLIAFVLVAIGKYKQYKAQKQLQELKNNSQSQSTQAQQSQMTSEKKLLLEYENLQKLLSLSSYQSYPSFLQWYQNTLNYLTLIYLETSSHLHFLSEINENKPPLLVHFSELLKTVTQSIILLILFGILCTLPIYVLKYYHLSHPSTTIQSSSYLTHSHTYSWFYSVNYIGGIVPSLILLFTWIVIVSLLSSGIIINHFTNKQHVLQINQKKFMIKYAIDQHNYPLFIRWFKQFSIFFVINLVIVGVANGAYIYCNYLHISAENKVGSQIALALFKYLWNTHLVTRYMLRSSSNVYLKTLFHVIVNIFNSILIPCIVIMCTDSACFKVCCACLVVLVLVLLLVPYPLTSLIHQQHIFVSPPKIQTSYAYLQCVSFSIMGACNLELPVRVDVAPIQTPFQYHSECSFELLRQYIPVSLSPFLTSTYNLCYRYIFTLMSLSSPF